MSWKNHITGVSVTTALTVAFALGGGLPATASTAPSDELAPALVETSSDVVAPNEAAIAKDSESVTAVPIVAIIVAAIAAGGTAHAMGAEAAKTAYYAGYRNDAYQQDKWLIRATAVGLVGPVLGISFMVGFQNQFYSMP